MHRFALVLSCLACASHARRVQTTADSLQSSLSVEGKKPTDPVPGSLAEVSASFVPSGSTGRLTVSNPNIPVSHAPPTTMGSAAGNQQRAHFPAQAGAEETQQMKVNLATSTAQPEKMELPQGKVQGVNGVQAKHKESSEVASATEPVAANPELEATPVKEKEPWYRSLSPNTLVLSMANLTWVVALMISRAISKTTGKSSSEETRPRLSRAGVPVMAEAVANTGPFQKLRQAMPPKKELKKVLPLAFMFFCILFNYTMLRDTKDVLVVTSGGAEVIPFLKTYLNLPSAIGVTVLYSNMVNRMSGASVFYTFVTGFTIFFASFAAVIYPIRNALHPIGAANYLSAHLPAGFGPLISIIKYWTFGAFYTMAELWGSVVVSLLFWGFANEVCSVGEAKRWYPLFGMIANVALIFSGQFVRYVSKIRGNLPAGVDPWGYSLNILMTAVAIGACLVILTYRWMQRNVLTDPECVPANMEKKKKKAKPKMSVGESFKYLVSSSYIRNLAFLVIAYGMSINIVEVTWKGKLKQAFPDPNAYSSFMGSFSTATGIVTLTMMFISRWILGRFGWGVASLVTPVMLGVTGISFFSLILFKDTFAPLTAALGLSPLMMAVLVGAAQNILSKGSKYSLFDPCKETAYIPLDSEMRTKGKAAIDVIGNPMGKSGGSFIQQFMIIACGSLAASTPFLGVILAGIICLWIKASRDLAVEFEEKAASMKEDEEEEPSASTSTAAAS